MAITFTKQPDNTKLIPAFNNQVFEFSSSTVTSPTHCLITNNVNGFVLKIYPNPSGVFWVNLKDLSKTFFEFKDEIPFTVYPGIYQDVNFFKAVNFNFKVTNGTTNDALSKTLNLLRYVVQDLDNLKTTAFQFLSKNIGFYNNVKLFYFFKGFPFSIDVYTPINGYFNFSTYGGDTETNLTDSGCYRKNISDGNYIDHILDFGTGYSYFSFINDDTDIISGYIKQIDCDGIYLKWLASDGSWRYWLFNQNSKDTITAKSLGQMDNDWNNPNESNAPVVEFGKSAENKIKLHSGDLDDYENEHLATLITAPKVYLYKGTKGVAGTLADWYEVELLTNTFITSDYGRKEKYVSVEIGHRINTMSLN